jgi:hypothetical protein
LLNWLLNQKTFSMKKFAYLFALCLMFSFSNAVAAPATSQSFSTIGEPEPHPYTIVLKFKVKGQTVYLQWLVSPDTTIDELRDVVSAWSNDPDVRMSYNGVVLQDGFTLADYGIGAGAIISCS